MAISCSFCPNERRPSITETRFKLIRGLSFRDRIFHWDNSMHKLQKNMIVAVLYPNPLSQTVIADLTVPVVQPSIVGTDIQIVQIVL